MKPKLRILFIEDSEDDALLLQLQIKKGGYDIEFERVDTAERVKTELKGKKWDIILSDYVMPHFNGLEALAILKESGIDIPFIIISGTIGEDIAVETMKSGAQDYIMKNNLQRLLPAIEREVRESKIRAERKTLEQKQRQAELDRLANLHFFESMDRVNRAIQGTNNLDQMMSDVLDFVLSIFDCDRTFLLYPCNPEASFWKVPMERNKPEYPGASTLGLMTPMDTQVSETLRILLESNGPVKFGPMTEHPLPADVSERFGFKSFISMALHPRVGEPWQFGIHQCSYPRVWTPEEERLLLEIGRRLNDALTSLLAHRELIESEERYKRITEGLTDYQYSVHVEEGRAVKTSQSPTCETITGYSMEEFFADPYLWLNMVEPADRELVRERVQQILSGKEIPILEHRIIRKDGLTRWVCDTTILHKDSSGKLLSYDGVIKDITERKQWEIELTRINRTLRMLSDTNWALIHIIDESALLKEVCQIVIEVGGYRMAWVGFAENDKAKTLRPVAHAGVDSEYIESAKVSWGENERGHGPGGTAIRTGQPCITRTIPSDSDFAPWREAAIKRGFKSIIALPLISEGKTFGALGIYSCEIDAFDTKEVTILKRLADDLSFGITTFRIRAMRDQAEKTLLESEQKFRSVFNTIEEALTLNELIYDSKGQIIDYRILEVNPAFEKDTGLTREQSVGMKATELYGSSSESIIRFWKTHLNSDHPIITDSYNDQNKTWKHIITSKPVQGKFVISYSDITERKNIEEALRDSEERYRLIAENTADTIVVYDLNLQAIYVSPSVIKIGGYSIQETMTQSLDQILTSESLKKVNNIFFEQMTLEKSGKADPSRTVLFEIETYCKDGSTTWIEIAASFLRDKNSKPTGILTITRDVSARKLAEQQLESQYALLSALINSSIDIIIFSLDTNYCYTTFNDKHRIEMKRIWKVDIDIGMNLLECMNIPKLRELAKISMDRALRGEAFTEIQRQQESDIYYEFSWNPIFQNKEVIGITAFVRDISERKRSEAQILKLNRIFAVLSNINQTIVRIRETKELLKEICRIAIEFGKFQMAWIGMVNLQTNKVDVVASYGGSDEYLQNINIDLNDEIQSGGATGVAIKTGIHKISNNIQNDSNMIPWKDKALIYGYKSSAAFPITVFNKVVGVFNIYSNETDFFEAEDIKFLVEIAEDISFALEFIESETERKQAETALRESEERYRTIFQNSPLGIFRLTFDGCFQEVNPALAKMLGYDSPETVIDNIRDISKQIYVNAEDHHRIVSIQLDSTDNTEHTIRYRRKNGGEFSAQLYLKTIFDTGGQPIFLEGIVEDITEKLSLESQLRQAQKMESIGRLAGGVAHDFNNMLGVIIGHTDLVLEELEPDNPISVSLQEIRKAAERSANLTRQLLAFARKQTITPRVLDLNEIVEGMLKIIRRLIGEDIDLAWLPETGIWSIKIDPSQIDQLLANLCVNARDAIAGVGKITIETHMINCDEGFCSNQVNFIPGDYVLLVVSDNGCGMTKEILSQLFEPFFTTKELGKGTGLGLATVYGIVQQNNGFIIVDSEIGHGSSFKIYLPRYISMAEAKKKDTLLVPAARGYEVLLLVEDELSILDLTTQMLEKLGYKVLAASQPKEAIQIAKEYTGEIHLIITDVVMPEMNGRDLAKSLVSIFPKIKQLFMSGYTGDVIAHHGVLDDGLNYIQKPFSMQTLAAKVRDVLDGK